MTPTRTTAGAGRLTSALLLALLAALLLALPGAASVSAAEPSASSGDPSASQPEPSQSADPSQSAAPTPQPTDGEVVVDPTFFTPTPEATQPSDAGPSGTVAGVTGRPEVTPPATDALAAGAASPGAGLPVLIAALAALSLVALVAAQLPAIRRR
jgi:hypothetical protein